MDKNGEKFDWKKADLEGYVRKDLEAAISILCMIRDRPEIFRLVVAAIEEWREQMVENEKRLEKVE